jgi:NAD(P)-dependent dehydrogenase (short-subunit alcohol dehydrogenase family)
MGDDNGEDHEFPPQTIERPGNETEMDPQPQNEMAEWVGSGKLEGKRALVTGGDSGIGRAVAVGFAKEGADVAISYLSEDDDAARSAELVEAEGRKALRLRGDLSDESECKRVIAEAAEGLGGLDVLVLHHGTQWVMEDFSQLSTEQWKRTLDTNLTSFFWLARESLQHLGEGSAIVMTGSVNGFRGNKTMVDYSASKGAIHTFAYALSQNLQERGIRVNCVAPGPVWTPLIPATFEAERVADFGKQASIGRAAQPDEIAPSYIFFASEQLSSYYTGQTLAPIGGETLPG